jgi:predicted metal-binding transcription factor (methanogenesis marker protein 9)
MTNFNDGGANKREQVMTASEASNESLDKKCTKLAEYVLRTTRFTSETMKQRMIELVAGRIRTEAEDCVRAIDEAFDHAVSNILDGERNEP